MNTFLPYPDFAASAAALDNKRLGKQRVECVQILRVLLGYRARGWVNHPAVRMWAGYERALWQYTRIVCDEWISRGYANTKCEQHLLELDKRITVKRDILPHWLGNEALHQSHRQNLVRKNPEFYGAQWPDEQPTEGYVWPCGRYELSKR